MNTLSKIFAEEDLLYLLELDADLKLLEDEEVEEFITYLSSLDCTDETIKECIYTNPSFLERTLPEIRKLVDYLQGKNIDDFDDLLTRNSAILNESPAEIEEWLEQFLKSGRTYEDALEEILDGMAP